MVSRILRMEWTFGKTALECSRRVHRIVGLHVACSKEFKLLACSLCFHTSSSESAAWCLASLASSHPLSRSRVHVQAGEALKAAGTEVSASALGCMVVVSASLLKWSMRARYTVGQAPVFLWCRSRCVGPVLLMLNCSGKHRCYVILLCNLHREISEGLTVLVFLALSLKEGY